MNKDNKQEFDPTKIAGTQELTDEERLALQQQEDQRIGDENEAAGLNRDGSAKATPAAVKNTSVAKVSSKVVLDNPDLGVGMREAPAGDTSTSSESLIIKRKLAAQPKMPIFLPLETGERKGSAYRSVTINGYRFEVKKGMMVMVPQAVHSLLVSAMEDSSSATEIDENLANDDGSRRRALGDE